MKRHILGLLIQPFKNKLIPPKALGKALNRFAEQIRVLGSNYPHIRFNLIFPGYFLEHIDPFLLSQLRGIEKRGALEWLLSGYTETFLGFSPRWLIDENIRFGLQTFSDLTGEQPIGFAPSFSHWEPSYVDLLRCAGLDYAVVSNELLPPDSRKCGYWITEYAGKSLVLFPYHTIKDCTTLPSNITEWLEGYFFSRNPQPNIPFKIAIIRYMVPIEAMEMEKSFRLLKHIVVELDKRILTYQPIRLRELPNMTAPIGLHYFHPSLPLIDRITNQKQHFLNYIHSCDQIGIIQRKLMDICDRIVALDDQKLTSSLKHTLFRLQDINRSIPADSYGFTNTDDRLWIYGKLIDIEKEIHKKTHTEGGQVRITDFYRNGTKSIIMSNRSAKVYVDHKNGGTIFELDFRNRSLNLCAPYTKLRYPSPTILSPGISRTSFIDHLYSDEATCISFMNGTIEELGNFWNGQFNYKIKKTPSGIKTVLGRQGAILRGEHHCPLGIEKVFGLEKDSAVLSFAYQLTNHSLTPYSFKFGIESTFSLPGTLTNSVYINHEHGKEYTMGSETYILEATTKWNIDDRESGVRIQFTTQKAVDVWCIPPNVTNALSHGLTIVIISPIHIEESATWSLIGKLVCKRIQMKGSQQDVL